MLRIVTIISLFACALLVPARRAFAAPALTFDPLTMTVSADDLITVSLRIDTTPYTTLTSAVAVRYNPEELRLVEIINGDVFPSLTSANDTQAGLLEITAYTTDKRGVPGRAGALAAVTFEGVNPSGVTTTLEIVCSGSGHDTNILTTKGANVYTCGAPEQAIIQLTASSSPILTGVNAPRPTQPSTIAPPGVTEYTGTVVLIGLLILGIVTVLVILRLYKNPPPPTPEESTTPPPVVLDNGHDIPDTPTKSP